MGEELDEPIERWTAKRRAALVLQIVKGEHYRLLKPAIFRF